MKINQFCVLVVAIATYCLLGASNSYAQQNQPTTQEFRLQQGSNTIQLAKGKGTLRFMYRNGAISNVSRTSPAGKVVRFKAAGEGSPTANTSDCPCGMTCFEDHGNQQSVCFCIECQGGSGGPSMFRMFGDSNGDGDVDGSDF